MRWSKIYLVKNGQHKFTLIIITDIDTTALPSFSPNPNSTRFKCLHANIDGNCYWRPGRFHKSAVPRLHDCFICHNYLPVLIATFLHHTEHLRNSETILGQCIFYFDRGLANDWPLE